MKPNRQLLNLPWMIATLALPAQAIEAPEDDAPPPAAAEAPAEQAPAPAERQDDVPKQEVKQETAYLGVVTSEVPEMLNEHLGLQPGEGIIVRSVMPDGPAAKAGIKVNDVITRVDEKGVASSQDLTERISAHQPGDKVRIDLIQKGKPANLDVALGTRPAQIGGMQIQPLDDLQLDVLPDEMADRIRRMIEGNVGGLDLRLEEGGHVQPPPQMEDAMRQMKERMEKALGGFQMQAPGFGGKIEVQQGATFKMLDDQGSVEIKSNDGSKEVTVRDKDNNISWTGPWDTDQDKAAAPEDVRRRVERLNIDTNFKGNGFRFNIRPGGPAPE